MNLLASLVMIIISLYSSPVLAQEPHVHGGEIPDWYDPFCCNQRDCRPVADDDIEFRTDALGNPIAIYKPTQNVFEQRQWLKSQDERYHVCINRGNGASLCFYVRAGA